MACVRHLTPHPEAYGTGYNDFAHKYNCSCCTARVETTANIINSISAAEAADFTSHGNDFTNSGGNGGGNGSGGNGGSGDGGDGDGSPRAWRNKIIYEILGNEGPVSLLAVPGGLVTMEGVVMRSGKRMISHTLRDHVFPEKEKDNGTDAKSWAASSHKAREEQASTHSIFKDRSTAEETLGILFHLKAQEIQDWLVTEDIKPLQLEQEFGDELLGYISKQQGNSYNVTPVDKRVRASLDKAKSKSGNPWTLKTAMPKSK